ncbi:hypothetical protein CAPTEDRAFT_211816 [Capitella teleta]|uniref:Reverse transcriptase domain-containing protein n=1 Tax=Capitella teleta TaxID=283909 RepID=R7UYR1_CAPTE|nr:hypothetical protein CAPTEDRAFT_211816 [Capitella teleta]|eukprot:ELU11698.1 hypothetical protein CAPTEDRAFT_211816 [Capitella teleta]
MQRTNNAIPNGTDWRSMIESHHSKELWKAIAWNGEIKNGQDEQTSGCEDFRLHFKELLNPIIERENLGASVETEDTGIYLPVTDDPIEPREVAEAAKSLKTNKSGGPSGLPRTPQIPTSDMVNLPCCMKEKCPPDGWLEWLHLLMLKDDTVLLATTRERAKQKIRILTELCHASGMAINQDKTKFMVIHGKPVDKEAITTRDDNDYEIIIENCNQHSYLGCIFTQDAKKTTASDLCLIEAGLPSVVGKLKATQKATIRRLLDEREEWQTIRYDLFIPNARKRTPRVPAMYKHGKPLALKKKMTK